VAASNFLLSVVMACAPNVHPDTAMRIIHHESGSNPYAIGINGPWKLSRQPSNKEQAIATAQMLINAGVSIDMGYSGINSKNLQRFGLTTETVFDPCQNVRAMEKHLSDSYARAVKRHGPGQMALRETLSEYNTGNPINGQRNGYVDKVFATVPK
jgi:type IV secretion system protein VirB1